MKKPVDYKDFKCACGCGATVRICEVWKDVGEIEINVRYKSERYWKGVILSAKDLAKMLEFIPKLIRPEDK